MLRGLLRMPLVASQSRGGQPAVMRPQMLVHASAGRCASLCITCACASFPFSGGPSSLSSAAVKCIRPEGSQPAINLLSTCLIPFSTGPAASPVQQWDFLRPEGSQHGVKRLLHVFHARLVELSWLWEARRGAFL